jgi:hypothetical protein
LNLVAFPRVNIDDFKMSSHLECCVVTFCLFMAALSTPADISINVNQPAPGATTSERLVVQAGVTSLYELTLVTASVDGRQTNLIFSAAVNAWTNTIPLQDLARGQKTLTVTAQDVFGNSAQTQRVFSLDNPPTLVVVAPLNGTVIRGQVYVEATATDDDPAGTVINVYNNYNPFEPASSYPQLRGTNSVRGYISGGSTMVFEAIDSAGNKRYIPRQVIGESSSNLVEAAAAPGTLLDFTADRFLYSFSADVPVASAPFNFWTFGKPEPRILDRVTQQTVVAAGDFPTNLAFGFLASTGALLGFSGLPPFSFYSSLLSWPGTNPVDYGLMFGGSNDVKVVGDVAAWQWNTPPFGPNQLFLRDIVQTNEQLILTLPILGFDLGPNLDLVYAVSNQVFRSRPASPNQPYQNRATTQLTFGDPATLPVTDGTNVVFSRTVSNGIAIVILTAAGEEMLALWPFSSSTGLKYQIRNGWVAFTKPGTAGQTQIWTRAPSGSLQQRTFFGSSSTLESLGPQGGITFLNSSLTPAGRYLGLPGGLPWWVNSSQGRVRWENGKLLLILGRSVFEVRAGRLSSTILADGNVRITFSGPVGLNYSLQTSPNLKQWSEMLIFTNSTGTLSWTNPPTELRQFYRTVTAPP